MFDVDPDEDPAKDGLRSLAKLEAEHGVLPHILAHAGIEDFLANLDDLYSRNNDERSEWQGSLLAWQSHKGNAPTLLATVASDVLGEVPLCRTLRDALPGTLADAAASHTNSYVATGASAW